MSKTYQRVCVDGNKFLSQMIALLPNIVTFNPKTEFAIGSVEGDDGAIRIGLYLKMNYLHIDLNE